MNDSHSNYDPRHYAPEPEASHEEWGDEEWAEQDGAPSEYDLDDDFYDEEPPRRRFRGFIAAVVALVVIVGAIGFGGTKAYHYVKDHLSGGGGDYSASDTHGRVKFTVKPSESGTQMARALKQLGIVKSVDAFIAAYNDNADAKRIAPGTYHLQLEMPSAAVITALLDHKNLVQTTLLITEGKRAVDVVAAVAKATKKPVAQVQKALDGVTLPESAGGDPEGYLFPATYSFAPGTTPADMFAQMVSTWQKQATQLGLKDTEIDGHTYTAQQLLTVASLVQAEGRSPQDMAKIARVIYNRIENPGAEGQTGALQIDATVDYALHRPLTVGLTQDERDNTDSPYNTFEHTGLPPGPIGNPGADAIKAALHPTDGDWYYYITVNLATGETKFAHTYAEFETYVAQHDHYCATQSASGCK